MMRLFLLTLRVCGSLAVLLGVLFWLGYVDSLIPLHIALGVLVTFSLWGAGILVGIEKGGSVGLMIGALVLSLVVMLFGLNQTVLLPGSLHWMVQAIHLLLGIAAVALGIPIERRYKTAKAARAVAVAVSS
jgi:hypothetical protein